MGSVIVWHSILTNNYATEEGGAIYTSANMELHHSMVLSSKSGKMGGGLYLTSGSNTVVNDVRFNFNESPEGGNNIYPEPGASLSGCGEIFGIGGDGETTTILQIMNE